MPVVNDRVGSSVRAVVLFAVHTATVKRSGNDVLCARARRVDIENIVLVVVARGALSTGVIGSK